MKKAKVRPKQTIVRESTRPKPVEYDFSTLERIPVTYGELVNLFAKLGNVDPSGLRKYTLQKIEQCTGTPVICYVTKTQNLRRGVSASIDDFDLLGFNDLLANVRPDARALDVVIISNGGSAEATERIVDLLRGRFSLIRFLVPHNAYSAATLMCFSGNEIIMGASGTLGPIDPQIDGIPARAILRGFAEVEKRLKEEGPETLTAYMPLISQYSLHLFEICKSAQELSKELAQNWISKYMLCCEVDDQRVQDAVDFFSDYDIHKSHGRAIGRDTAKKYLHHVRNAETIPGLADMMRSLHNQYELFFDQTPFYKLFEDARGTSWGRQMQAVNIKLPLPSQPPE